MKFRGIPNTKKLLRVELLEKCDLLSVFASNGDLTANLLLFRQTVPVIWRLILRRLQFFRTLFR